MTSPGAGNKKRQPSCRWAAHTLESQSRQPADFGRYVPLDVMRVPVRIDCPSIFDVPDTDSLAARADGDQHVVLQFPSLHADEAKTLIAHLSNALPSFSVFQSSPTLSPAKVTVLRVISDSAIFTNVARISAAVTDYLLTSQALVEQ